MFEKKIPLSFLLVLLILFSACSIRNAEAPVPVTAAVIHTPTSTPTRSPIPTDTADVLLPYEERVEILQNLLQTNGGCQLPCWWGEIVPGITTWAEAENSLRPLADSLWIPDPTNNRAYAGAAFYSLPRTLSIDFIVQDGVIQMMRITGLKDTDAYSLSPFLSTNGRPGEVWMTAQVPPIGPGDEVYVELFLFYPEKGVLATYVSWEDITQADSYTGCFDSNTMLVLWSSGYQLTLFELLDEVAPFGGYDPYLVWLPLFESTGISVDEFYVSYHDDDNVICLETPAELWQWQPSETPTP